MRIAFSLQLLVGLAAGSLSAASIQFQTTPLGGNSYHYNYILSGITFAPFERLDFQFGASTFGTLSNPLAPSGFTTSVLQPNNPPGAPGDYGVTAQVNNPSIGGPFGVDVVFLGTGLPGAQLYTLNQFDANGNFISTIATGTTTPVSGGVPEPSTFAFTGGAMLLAGLSTARRRRISPADLQK